MNPYVPPQGYQNQQQQETAPQPRPFDLTQVLGTDRARESAMRQQSSPYTFMRQVSEQRDGMFGPHVGGM